MATRVLVGKGRRLHRPMGGENWLAIQMLLDELERLPQERRQILAMVAIWHAAARTLQKLEDRVFIAADDPRPEETRYHRGVVRMLMGTGDRILQELRNHAAKDPDITRRDIQNFAAYVEEIHDKYAMWHSDVSATRRAKVLREVFGVER